MALIDIRRLPPPSRVSAAPGVARDLVALTKPGVTVQVVGTTAGGMWLAGWPAASTAASCLIGTTLVVAAANTLNCYLERDTDARMARTRGRPLAAGRLAPAAGVAFGLALAAVSVPLLAWGAGPLCGLLGALALVTYVGVYTPMKRRSAWALPVGAVPGAVPPLLGWTAATGRLDAGGLVLFAVLFLWQHPHFLAIAIRRRADYAAAGLHTVAGALGDRAAGRLAIASVVLLAPVSLALVPLGVTGAVYGVAAGALGAAWIGRAAAGWRRAGDPRWAGRLFGDSLVYLTALFVAVALDAGFG